MYPKAKKPLKKEKFKKSKIEVINHLNPLSGVIKDYYLHKSSHAIELFVEMLPPSANKLYEKGVRFSVKHNKQVIHCSNHPDIEVFRNFVWKVVNNQKAKFVPTGTVAAVIELYSKDWLNKDGTTKKKDSDNMIKPLMDALEEALGFPDELVYYHHVFKVIPESDRQAVKVTLFDTDPIIYH